MKIMSKTTYVNNAKAFTLIELLVVITIIALLVSILLPSLNKARDSAKTVYCSANQKGLGTSMIMYVGDNNGISHWGPNRGYWYKNGTSGEMYDKDDENAYWGIAYYKYAQDMEVFHCPSSRFQLQKWDDEENDEVAICYWTSFGLNGFFSHRKTDRIKRPSEMIVIQDHFEQKLDNNGVTSDCQGTDMFFVPDDDTQHISLLQWRRNMSKWVRYSILECFRHNRTSRSLGEPGDNTPRGTGVSETFWLDGHVSDIAQSDGKDVQARWYTGGHGDGTESAYVGKTKAVAGPVRTW